MCGSALNMTTESFAEFLNKLKEIHEKEVQGRETQNVLSKTGQDPFLCNVT